MLGPTNLKNIVSGAASMLAHPKDAASLIGAVAGSAAQSAGSAAVDNILTGAKDPVSTDLGKLLGGVNGLTKMGTGLLDLNESAEDLVAAWALGLCDDEPDAEDLPVTDTMKRAINDALEDARDGAIETAIGELVGLGFDEAAIRAGMAQGEFELQLVMAAMGVDGAMDLLEMLATEGAVEACGAASGTAATRNAASKVVSPQVPGTLARVVPGNISPTTLGVTDHVFVTDAALLRGLNAAQIAEKLEIPASTSFKIIEFSSEGVSGIAVPIRNASPGFIGNGFTSGGLPEFVIPNGPIPSGAVIRSVP